MQSSYTATIRFHTVATNSHVTEQINRKFKVPNASFKLGDCEVAYPRSQVSVYRTIGPLVSLFGKKVPVRMGVYFV